MNRLEGKVGVVTGAALRLGRATCARMAEEGAAISVLDVLDDEGRAPAESLRGQGVMQPHLAGQVARHSVRAGLDYSPRRIVAVRLAMIRATISMPPNTIIA